MTLIWPLSWLMPLLHFSYGGNGEFVQTLVGERLTLITPKRFQSANSCLLVKVYPRESPQSGRVPVAELTKSQWNPVPDYKDRLTPGDGVEFKEATYNDNGNYEITCNNIRKIIIQVEVLVPHELRVSAGDSVKLPCYFNTKARSVEGVRWEQGQELVMENYFTSNELNSGERFKRKVNMSQDARHRGDLSLSIHSVQSLDQGPFFCKVKVLGREWFSGKPAVVKLWIWETTNNATYVSTCFSGSNTVSSISSSLLWWTLAIALFFVIVIS